MKIEGSEKIDADPGKVWVYLSDPEKIIKCVPGVVEWSISEGVIKAKVKQGIGFIKGTFDVSVAIEKNDPVKREALLRLQGSSNMGNFTAGVVISMKASEGGNELSYSADANVSGMMGTLSSSIIANTIKKIVKDMLQCVSTSVQTADLS